MYQYFAEFYDDIMGDVDYTEWAEYIIDLVEHSGVRVSNVLELGCGTGNVIFELEKYSNFNRFLGIDISESMIQCASKKAKKFQSKCKFLVADMINFSLKKPFDLIYSVFDTINHIINEKDLRRMLLNVYFNLSDNKLFIFDIILTKKIESFFSNNSFAREMGDYAYIWECECLEFNRLFNIKTTFFKRKRGNLFEKFIENHYKRIYTVRDMKNILEEMDFKIHKIYDAYTFRPFHDNSERVFFVTSKGGT